MILIREHCGMGMALSKDGKGDVKEMEQGLDDLTRLEK